MKAAHHHWSRSIMPFILLNMYTINFIIINIIIIICKDFTLTMHYIKNVFYKISQRIHELLLLNIDSWTSNCITHNCLWSLMVQASYERFLLDINKLLCKLSATTKVSHRWKGKSELDVVRFSFSFFLKRAGERVVGGGRGRQEGREVVSYWLKTAAFINCTARDSWQSSPSGPHCYQ